MFRGAAMKPVWLLLSVFLLASGCPRKERSQVKPRPSDGRPQVVRPEEGEAKAATPEDPGPLAKAIVPLEILRKQAKAQLENPEEEKEEEKKEELRPEPLPIDHPVYIEP